MQCNKRQNFFFNFSVFLFTFSRYYGIMKYEIIQKEREGANVIKKLIKKFKKLLVFLLNPHFLICFGLAWMITNGWCYIFICAGTYYDIEWMLYVGSSYLVFIWSPVTPEKIITIPLAIALLKLIFPKDEKTLAVLTQMHKKAKETLKNKKRKRKEKKQKTVDANDQKA